MADPEVTVGVDEVEALLESLEELLDLFDEEPMGATYYPFKAAELIELYGRMATGDRPDDAPVPLSEWGERFAGRVDRQLDESGIADARRPGGFAQVERTLWGRGAELTGDDDVTFRAHMADSREKGAALVSALSSALR
ncbi:hypothetical protein [Streptomyces sp. NPDC003863]